MTAGVHLPEGGESVDSNCELMLEYARLIRQGLWRMARLAQDAAESLDGRIEDLDWLSEAVEVREALKRVQNLGIDVSASQRTGTAGKPVEYQIAVFETISTVRRAAP